MKVGGMKKKLNGFRFRHYADFFISNYLTLALFLLSRKKGFATLLSVIVIT